MCPAWRGRARTARPCLVTHLRLGGRHAPELDLRFRRAAEVARRLSHPAIAETLAVGRLDDELFVAHAFLDGVDLGRINTRAIDWRTGVFLATEIARALEYLHGFEDRGLVHHGVAPINIHLGFDGRVRLLECGLATSSKDENVGAPRPFHGGTRYVAPEARIELARDARSDLYAIGVLLWELLAGRSWVADEALGDGSGPTLRADEFIVKDNDEADTTKRALPGTAPTPPSPRAPAALYAIVAKAMNPDPEKRHSSARELRLALAPFGPGRLRGRRALRRLLNRLFDAEDSRRRISANLELARPLLPLAEPVTAAHRRRRRRIVWAVRAAGLAALSGGALLAESLVDQRGAVAPVSTVALERAAESFAPAEPERPMPAVISGGEAATLAAAPPAAPPPAEAPAPAAVPAAEAPPPRLFGPPAPPPRAGRMEARALRPARARRPDKNDAAARALESLKSAEARFQWGDLDGAESLARVAVRELAQSPRAFYLLGVVLLAKGEAAQAKTAFERTLAIDPAFPDADAKLRLANDRAALSHP